MIGIDHVRDTYSLGMLTLAGDASERSTLTVDVGVLPPILNVIFGTG